MLAMHSLCVGGGRSGERSNRCSCPDTDAILLSLVAVQQSEHRRPPLRPPPSARRLRAPTSRPSAPGGCNGDALVPGLLPLGSQRRKGTRQLVAKATREEVVDAIAHHLTASSYHYMSPADAMDLAESDEWVHEHEGDFEGSAVESTTEYPERERAPRPPDRPPPSMGLTSIKGGPKGGASLELSGPIGSRGAIARRRNRSRELRSPRRAPDVILRVGEVQQVRRGVVWVFH